MKTVRNSWQRTRRPRWPAHGPRHAALPAVVAAAGRPRRAGHAHRPATAAAKAATAAEAAAATAVQAHGAVWHGPGMRARRAAVLAARLPGLPHQVLLAAARRQPHACLAQLQQPVLCVPPALSTHPQQPSHVRKMLCLIRTADCAQPSLHRLGQASRTQELLAQPGGTPVFRTHSAADLLSTWLDTSQ